MTIGASQSLRAKVITLDRAVDRFANLVQVGRHWASARGDRTAFAFLRDGEVESDALTFAALDRKARAIAACLQDAGLAEKLVLLLFPSGLEFIAGFLACLYARAIAIPGHPMLGPGDAVRIRSIIAGSGAEVVLTNASVIASLHGSHEAAEIFSSLELIDIDAIDEARAGEWVNRWSARTTSPLFNTPPARPTHPTVCGSRTETCFTTRGRWPRCSTWTMTP
jgi:acyl-CoA synthetase (AMP-forming)/AMP-acid ligase II